MSGAGASITTPIARVCHTIDLDGRVLAVDVEPIGNTPAQVISAVCNRSAALLDAAAHGPGLDSDAVTMLNELNDLVKHAGALIDAIQDARSRRDVQPVMQSGYHLCATHLVYSDEFELLNKSIQEVRPYLIALSDAARKNVNPQHPHSGKDATQ